MKQQNSAFYNHAVKLTISDYIKLLFGKQIKDGALIVGLWKMPDNGCPHCKPDYVK